MASIGFVHLPVKRPERARDAGVVLLGSTSSPPSYRLLLSQGQPMPVLREMGDLLGQTGQSFQHEAGIAFAHLLVNPA